MVSIFALWNKVNWKGMLDGKHFLQFLSRLGFEIQ